MQNALRDTVLERLAGGPLRLGTRTSAMAMAQAARVRARLTAEIPELEVEFVPITTSADLWPGDLAELGGKGNFTKEIDRKLIAGEVDIAVHAMKDVPGDVPLPKGTAFGAYLPREDVRDVFVAPAGSEVKSVYDLPDGALVGTSSVRRRAQLGLVRPEVRTERIRGAVDTRIEKLDRDGKFAGLILARAGLLRIGQEARITQLLPVTHHDPDVVVMVPAIGAGVVGIQARSADEPIMELLDTINTPHTARCLLAERTALHMLMGHCNSPIAGHCTDTPDGKLSMIGMVFNRDGSQWVRAQHWGDPDDPAALGSMVAADLLRQGARKLITATRA